uniref:Uncharacterized protein n=1 Tax=Arundo donax TaxID=35708 RepID=A0A0A8ZJX3_ARUDO
MPSAKFLISSFNFSEKGQLLATICSMPS